MRFVGNIEAKTDAKGRVFLPSTFRKVLQTGGEEKLFLRKDIFQPCLVIYPQSVWDEQLNLLRSHLNRWNAAHQQLFRQFVADVEQITLDGNGRFLIPRRYMKMTGIEDAVRFIGMDDTIEIWSAEVAESKFMDTNEFARQLESVMATPQNTDNNN